MGEAEEDVAGESAGEQMLGLLLDASSSLPPDRLGEDVAGEFRDDATLLLVRWRPEVGPA